MLGDQEVRAGDKVVIWFGAANRDPEVFAEPHRLDLRRDPNPHVAFGVGPHFCLGAHLARLEAAEMLRQPARRAPRLAVGEPVRVASNFINGIAHLPVRIGPAVESMPRQPSTRGQRRAKPREKPQQIADELRRLIISGELDEGDSLGHEPELIERFGVSRPSLREALRILEAEGLISVVRGVQGGVRVHRPDQRLTARTAALVLQARNVSLADVFEARTIIEPAAVRLVAGGRNRTAAAASGCGR